jgi:hypothetical protein
MPAIVRRTSPPRGEPIRSLSANFHQKKRQAQAVTDDAPLVKRSVISRKRISFRHHLPLVERKMISAHGLVVEWRTDLGLLHPVPCDRGYLICLCSRYAK